MKTYLFPCKNAAVTTLTAVLFAGIWSYLFAPGYVSFDAAIQWKQALSANFTDWHPVGVTYLMRLVSQTFSWTSITQKVWIFTFAQELFFWPLKDVWAATSFLLLVSLFLRGVITG
jgi:hypothetical protein